MCSPGLPECLRRACNCTRHSQAAERGEAPALVVCTGAEEEQALSYTELAYRVRAVARGLLRLGLRKGDRVGVWMPNNAEWTVTQLATAAVGMVLVNINPGTAAAPGANIPASRGSQRVCPARCGCMLCDDSVPCPRTAACAEPG